VDLLDHRPLELGSLSFSTAQACDFEDDDLNQLQWRDDDHLHSLPRLYQDPRRRQHLARAAFEAALNPEYSWDAIAGRFDDLFAELAQ
jgi:hypothetical protein